MININKKWILLTSSKVSSLGCWSVPPVARIGALLAVLMVFAVQVGSAQVKPVSHAQSGSLGQSSSTETSLLPASSGNPNLCSLGATTTLVNSTPGGVWSSSKTSVATVNATTGVVTAVGQGQANISYTVGALYTYTNVSVVGQVVGATTNVCAGNTISLYDSTFGGYFTSGNTAAATVSTYTNASGLVGSLVTGVAAGSSVITYNWGAAPYTCQQTTTVTVSAGLATPITGTTTLCVAGTTTLANTTTPGTFTIAPTSVATINASTGVVTGVSAGTATVTYTINGGCFVTKNVTVYANTIAAISGAATVCSGNTITFTDATAGGTWSSSTANAAVNIGGGVTGVTAGAATITYSRFGCYKTFATTVITNDVPAITGGNSVVLGGSLVLNDANATGTWSLNVSGVCTLNPAAGVCTVNAPTSVAMVGAVIVTYTGASTCYKTNNVSIISTAINPIVGSSTMCFGHTGAYTDASSGGTWSSSDLTIATVNAATGVVTPVAAGTFTLSYTVSGATVTLPVTVSAPTIAGPATALCGGTAGALTLNPAGGTLTSTAATSIISVDVAGNYVGGIHAGTTVVSYTVGGCVATKTLTNNTPDPITGPTTACYPLAITLHDYTIGGTWALVSGTGASINASSGAVTPSVATGGTVVFKYTANACSLQTTVNVYPAVTAIVGTPLGCAGGPAVTLSEATLGGTWTSTAASVATIDPVSGVVTPLTVGSTDITYTATTGCNYNETMYISAPPAAITNPDVPGNFQMCASGWGSIRLLNATPGGSWISGNPGLAYVSHDTVTGHGTNYTMVTGTATGTVTISYAMPSGCAATAVLTLNPNDAGSITVSTGVLCNGSTSTFVASLPGSWSSSVTSVATVDGSGVVTAVGTGGTIIRHLGANTAAGCYAATVLTVNAAPAPITGGQFAVCAGSNTVAYADATPGGTWFTSAIGIASINPVTRIVTGVSAGLASISYTLPGGCQTYQPLVVDGNSVSSLTPSGALCSVGTTTVNLTPATASWTSSNTSVATVSGSVLTLGAVGVTTLTATAGVCVNTAIVTVNATVPTAITGTLNYNVGCTNATSLSCTPAAGTWKSTTTTVASISSGGVITAVAPGTSVISYTYKGCTGPTTTVTIAANTLNPITPSANPGYICSGAIVAYADATPSGTWSIPATYSVVATCDVSGNVTALSAGTAILTYATGACSVNQTIYVNTVTPTAISVGAYNPICLGTFPAFVATDATVGGTWSSSNPSGLSIDTYSGAYEPITAGTYSLTYTYNGCTVTTPLTVNSALAITSALASGFTICQDGTTTGVLSVNTAIAGTWSVSDPVALSLTSPSGSTVTMQAMAYGTPIVTFSETGIPGCYVTKSVTVAQQPVALTGGAANLCVGSMTEFVETSLGGAKWGFSSGGAYATISTSGLVTGVAPGTATVTYAATGCATTVNATVVVVAVPAVITGTTNVICSSGSSVVLTDATTGGNWTYSGGYATVTPSGNTATVTGSSVGIELITYTEATGTCSQTYTVWVETTCGREGGNNTITENNAAQSYTLYPNPNAGNITLTQTVVNDGPSAVKVVNYLGATVYSGTLNFSNGKAELNMTDIVSGMYLVQINDANGGVQTFKMVVEK